MSQNGTASSHTLKEKKLEQFADDCTVFLEPEEASLRARFRVLNEFFNISGLKISSSKTSAVWFGHGSEGRGKICEDLNLLWATKFKLLGITFTFNLEGMESNFHEKIEAMKRVFNCWIYRKISPYGKITIIKSLALSKLSYVALIMPTLGKKHFKTIEQLCQKFLWGDQKSVKVSKEDTALPEASGGLGMLDLGDFWDSLKFSWIRRAINSNDEWPKMLALTISEQIGHYTSITDFLQLGSSKIKLIASKLDNIFWRQVLTLTDKFLKGGIFCTPQRLFLTPVWENPYVLLEGKPIHTNKFASLGKKLSFIYEFYNQKTGTRKTRLEINRQFNTKLTQEKFNQITNSLDQALIGVGLKKNALLSTKLQSDQHFWK